MLLYVLLIVIVRVIVLLLLVLLLVLLVLVGITIFGIDISSSFHKAYIIGVINSISIIRLFIFTISSPGLMSHVSWTPSGAPPSSEDGYPNSGSSPMNCAALSRRWTGWPSSEPARHASPTQGLGRGWRRIRSGSLHSIPRQSRVSFAV